jgi:hypothetical protein
LEVPKIFVDEQSTRILLAALNQPRSVVQLSTQCGIPIAICCYRVKMLEQRGLLLPEGTDGFRTLYRAAMTTAYLFVDKGVAKATFRPVDAEMTTWSPDPQSQL